MSAILTFPHAKFQSSRPLVLRLLAPQRPGAGRRRAGSVCSGGAGSTRGLVACCTRASVLTGTKPLVGCLDKGRGCHEHDWSVLTLVQWLPAELLRKACLRGCVTKVPTLNHTTPFFLAHQRTDTTHVRQPTHTPHRKYHERALYIARNHPRALSLSLSLLRAPSPGLSLTPGPQTPDSARSPPHRSPPSTACCSLWPVPVCCALCIDRVCHSHHSTPPTTHDDARTNYAHPFVHRV